MAMRQRQLGQIMIGLVSMGEQPTKLASIQQVVNLFNRKDPIGTQFQKDLDRFLEKWIPPEEIDRIASRMSAEFSMAGHLGGDVNRFSVSTGSTPPFPMRVIEVSFDNAREPFLRLSLDPTAWRPILWSYTFADGVHETGSFYQFNLSDESVNRTIFTITQYLRKLAVENPQPY